MPPPRTVVPRADPFPDRNAGQFKVNIRRIIFVISRIFGGELHRQPQLHQMLSRLQPVRKMIGRIPAAEPENTGLVMNWKHKIFRHVKFPDNSLQRRDPAGRVSLAFVIGTDRDIVLVVIPAFLLRLQINHEGLIARLADLAVSPLSRHCPNINQPGLLELFNMHGHRAVCQLQLPCNIVELFIALLIQHLHDPYSHRRTQRLKNRLRFSH